MSEVFAEVARLRGSDDVRVGGESSYDGSVREALRTSNSERGCFSEEEIEGPIDSRS